MSIYSRTKVSVTGVGTHLWSQKLCDFYVKGAPEKDYFTFICYF